VVHDVPDDGQDTIEADDKDGAGEGIGMNHPLFDEVTIIGIPKGKNVGGTKEWRCNHCKKTYKGCLTRVRVHLLGPLPGKKAQIIGRWEKMNLPLHCLAYALCPKFYHQQ
jgi:hypothetical protein